MIRNLFGNKDSGVTLRHFFAAVSQNFEGIVITDSEGIILYVNFAWQRLTGWESSEVVGRVTPRVIKSGKHSKEFYESLWKTIKSGKIFKMQITNKRKDGAYYDVDEIILPLKDEKSGKVLGFAGFQRDISERKKSLEVALHNRNLSESIDSLYKTEKAMLNILEDARELENKIREEKDRVSGIISSVGDALFVVNRDFKITMVNGAAEKLLNTKTENILNKSIREVISLYKGNAKVPDESRPVTMVINKGINFSAGLEENYSLEITGKKRIPVSIVSTPFVGDGGGAVVAFKDISRDKGMQVAIERQVIQRTSELKNEQAKLSASINSLNVGFIMTDIGGGIINMNGTAKRLLCSGHPGANSDVKTYETNCSMQMITKRLGGQVDLPGNIKACISEQKPINIGSIPYDNLFLQIFMSPIVDIEEGVTRVLGAVILVEDVTEAKLLERSRDEFFSIASHELRTPLTAIRGNTSLIKQFFGDKLKDPELKDMIDDIGESSVRLIEIVNDFLDMSRLEMGKIEFKQEKVNLLSVAKEVVAELSVSSKAKKLKLDVVEPKYNLPDVIADCDRLKQVLINLIGNSIKFTEKGGITVSFEAIYGKGEAPEFLKVLVADTGKGVDPANQKLLFRKFQQAGSSLYTRDTSRGTGLGLYISRLIVEAMGGEIALEKTEAGKGSVFYVKFPVLSARQLGGSGSLKVKTEKKKLSELKSVKTKQIGAKMQ